MAIGTYISVITVNVNGWMLQPKDTDWLNGSKKKDPYMCCLQETRFRPKDTYKLKSENMEKYIPSKWEAIDSWSSNSSYQTNRP